jgi:spore maturation protein CgeB
MEGYTPHTTEPFLTAVLGMHRSGTSAITHLLIKAGFYAGEEDELIQGNQWNRDGFFERWKVVKTNDRILGLCGGAWDFPPEEQAILGIAMDQEIADLLTTYEGRSRTVIKDPRLCLTFPVWQRVWGEKVRIIAITRHPDAVAKSLMKRDGFFREKSLALWKAYNERIARYVQGHSCFALPYEELFSSQRETRLRELSAFLQLSTSLEEYAADVIDPSLQHHGGEDRAARAPSEEEMKQHALYRKAHELLQQGNQNGAIGALAELVGLFPHHALAHNDLGVLYHRKKDLAQAMRHLEQAVRLAPDDAQARNNLAQLRALAHPRGTEAGRTPAKAMPQPAEKPSIELWWQYPKFTNGSSRVVLISYKHLLLTEVRNAFSALGHQVRVLLLGSDELPRSEVVQRFNNVLKEVKPDFVLTINHRGFDHEGVVTGLLTEYQIPFASWYVDSPHLIIRHYANNRSPYLTLFLWDQDYVPIAKQLGFDKVAYLPLGVDETQFRPLKKNENPFSRLGCDLSFVGNSMAIKTRTVLARNRINGALLKNFPNVSRAFEKSDHLVVRDLLAEEFPDLARELASLSEPQALGYETGVTWQATGCYRGELVKALKPFDPLIVGDPGWKEVVGEDFRLHRELNYYGDLSYFYNVSAVSFNATSRQMKNGVNQRVFDVPACKSVVVTDWTTQLEALMEPGREVLAYRRAEEIPDLVERALRDERFRQEVAEKGYQRVRSEHTYRHRVEQLIGVMRQYYG